jgi:uncharacterized protein YcbK (DUF882 family)
LRAQPRPQGSCSRGRARSAASRSSTLTPTRASASPTSPTSLARLDAFLRDHRTGEAHAIDRSLYDILNDLKLATRTRSPFQVISGYRSPRTNATLRENGRGVASGSLHLQGRAIDVRLADVDSAVLRDAALELARGGVGYYRRSDFVHVDTGRVRRW